ncbi:hypothetical protein B0H13DRAFT_1858618 [Mycena leptocephala]|nr:hypothetical protein B0H13DRAFT_1858618 [Mycena leptocephala]
MAYTVPLNQDFCGPVHVIPLFLPVFNGAAHTGVPRPRVWREEMGLILALRFIGFKFIISSNVRVVPCSGFDISPRQVVVTTGFVIDTRLDATKLQHSLALLVEQKFPRAGARLALRNVRCANASGRVYGEEHSEPYASDTRPPIQHLLNASSSEPWICSAPLLNSYFMSSSCPVSLDAFLAPNTPLIHVHATVFDDLTFLGMTSTHITFDAQGISTLMHGWQRVLAGGALEDIPGMPWDIAPFPTSEAPALVPVCQRGWFELGALEKIAFEENKVVRVPKAFLEKRKREIMGELKAEGSEEWVGSSDVLMAWWFKVTAFTSGWLMTSYTHRTDATPLHIHLAVDLRDMPIFPGAAGNNELVPISTPFINNAALFISIPPLPTNMLGQMSLRDLALHIRRAINAYKDDVDGIAGDMRSRSWRRVLDAVECAQGRVGQLDFSAAAEAGTKARVRYATTFIPSRNIPFRGSGATLFEDEEAVWMAQIRGVKDWEAMDKAGMFEFA